MKQFNSSTIISSAIIGLSIVASSFIIANHQSNPSLPVNESKSYKPLMSIAETADYLHLTEQQVRTIIEAEERILSTTNSYEGKMFPVIKIKGELYIGTDELTEWIQESVSLKKNYE
ncbi:MAG: hypothetical protein K0Q90_2724 [Paenibacillaceae bacterium]|nr:hypothetical protein [Paenibacillaceae bacterium]